MGECVDNLQNRINCIEDIKAIEQLQYRYAWAIDGTNVDPGAIAACFLPDGRWISDGLNIYCTGRDQIRQFFSQLTTSISQGLHYTTNISVVLGEDGTAADMRAYLATFAHVLPTPDKPVGGVTIIATVYNNKCRKVDGQWFFQELKAERKFSSEPTVGWGN